MKIKTRIGRIGYLNVDPIYYGLENGLKPSWVQLTAAPPVTLNRMMAEENLDISPVSTGAYARHCDDWLILPDLSISCQGAVMSVLLATRYPLKELSGKHVLITSESGTAVLLLRLIFAINGLHPIIQTGHVEAQSNPADHYDAVMIIGDKALSGRWDRQYQFRLDLGELWYQLSGLPIVFAVWAVRASFAQVHPDLVRETVDLFKQSARMGNDEIDRIIASGAKRLNLGRRRLEAYFQAMEYDLDSKKRDALSLFFKGLHEHGIIDRPAPLAFFR